MEEELERLKEINAKLRARLNSSEFLLFKLYAHVRNTREGDKKSFKMPSKLEIQVLEWLKLNRIIP